MLYWLHSTMGRFFDSIRRMFDPADDFYSDDFDVSEILNCIMPDEKLNKDSKKRVRIPDWRRPARQDYEQINNR